MEKLVQQPSTLEQQLGLDALQIPDDPYSKILQKLWDEDEPDLTELLKQRVSMEVLVLFVSKKAPNNAVMSQSSIVLYCCG